MEGGGGRALREAQQKPQNLKGVVLEVVEVLLRRWPARKGLNLYSPNQQQRVKTGFQFYETKQILLVVSLFKLGNLSILPAKNVYKKKEYSKILNQWLLPSTSLKSIWLHQS